MPVPLFCPQPDCPNHLHPALGWRVRFGHYPTAAHGLIQRYRCRCCGHALSDQTHSLHYYAKRHLPLGALWSSLVAGSCLREIATRYRLSAQTVQQALLRLGRQAMAAQCLLLTQLAPQAQVVIDGLRSFLCCQDYPCELLACVSKSGEMILQLAHFISRRSGRISPAQLKRLRLRYRHWSPPVGALSGAISSLCRQLWNQLSLSVGNPSWIHSDEHPLYRHFLLHDPVARHLRDSALLHHQRTASTAPRTRSNPLFPVNYIDRLLRHRMKEHTRESIAFGRNTTMQMHRAWIFAYDHNCRRPHRTRLPQSGSHAAVAGVPQKLLDSLSREFFTRRIRLQQVQVPMLIRQVWLAELATPPVRWRRGQRASAVSVPGISVRIPDYVRRDLAGAYQQAA